MVWYGAVQCAVGRCGNGCVCDVSCVHAGRWNAKVRGVMALARLTLFVFSAMCCD